MKIHHEKIKHPEHHKAGERHTWFWIKIIRENGRIGIWGKYASKQEAERIAGKINSPYEIIELKTSDEAEASRIIRGKVLEESGDVELSFRRFSHKRD